MPVFKCKMCGGDLQLNENVSVGECNYCGTRQTLPRLDDDKRANLYDRANHFRRNGEFDKAAAIYDTILNEDKTDAEAYWSIVLCKYGIEYVEDPRSHKRIPTCNRTQFTSIFADEDYRQAIANADASAKVMYEAEAKVIDKIQKGILDISAKEEPFDVFICYKESDQNGRRTPDSVLAQDLYFQLKQDGFKVFFSRITLEDKLGTAYEPYIFAALNSSKVMVVIGTKPENFNSPWVKNEWSRYLALVKNGASKILIPAYKDMDPYDLPEEFSHLQAQDMGKLGFMQDLIRGINKILQRQNISSDSTTHTDIEKNVTPIQNLLRRADIFLEEESYDNALEYYDRVLDQNPESSKAYWGKLLCGLHCKNDKSLIEKGNPLGEYKAYKNAIRFSSAQERDKYISINKEIQMIFQEQKRLENEQIKEREMRNAEQKNKAESEWKVIINKCQPFKTQLLGYRSAFLVLIILSVISTFILFIGCDFPIVFEYAFGYYYTPIAFFIVTSILFLIFIIALAVNLDYKKIEKRICDISVDALTRKEKAIKWYGLIFTAIPLILHLIFSIIDAS